MSITLVSSYRVSIITHQSLLRFLPWGRTISVLMIDLVTLGLRLDYGSYVILFPRVAEFSQGSYRRGNILRKSEVNVRIGASY
jgi:hypothetical protein